MKAAEPRRPTVAFALAASLILAVVLAAPASTATGGGSAKVAGELWAVRLDVRSASKLTRAALSRARAGGVNAVVVSAAERSQGSVARARKLAVSAGLFVPSLRPGPGCGSGSSRRAEPCIVYAPTVAAALRLSRRSEIDLVVVRIGGPGAVGPLADSARGHILAIAGLGGSRPFDNRLWRSAVEAAHESDALDLGVSLGKAGSVRLGPFLQVLAAALRKNVSPKPVTDPPAAAPPRRGGAALAAPLPASTGATFYVAPNGSNGGAGTLGAPWRTIQKALDALKPGQRALVRAGTYTEDLELRRAGTASAPITVEAYPGERPVLASAGSHPLEIGDEGAYFRFSGFVVEKHPGTSGGNIDVYGHHIELSGNEIRRGTDQGVYTAEESHHVQILGNWIHDNGKGIAHQSHGIYLQGDDHLVANNLIHDHPEGFGIQVYDEGSRALVVSNTITGAGHSGIVVGGDGGVDGVIVRNNVFAFNAHYGISHDSTCPSSSVADHNVVFGNRWGPTQAGCSGLDFSGGNRTGNPLFADYDKRDFRLLPGSAALDYGLAEYAPGGDHSGRARPQASAPDAGAFEH